MSGYVNTLSADSKLFMRGDFAAPMGVCLCFSNVLDYEEFYDELIEKLFEEYSLNNNKSVYSSSDISSRFGRYREDFLEFLKSFVQCISNDEDVRLNVVYTTLSTSQLPSGVPIYGSGRYPRKYIPVPQFLRLISQYYPYLCAWIVSKRAVFHGRNVALDNIQGEVTKAWQELTSDHIVNIYPSGDLVNREISSADLCVRYIDETLYTERKGLRRDDLEYIFDNDGVDGITHYLGHDELDDIRPIEKKSILSPDYIISPMVYILKEQIMEKEIEYLKARPDLMDAIAEYVHQVKGGFKFIDYTKDYKFLRDGDHLICLGPKGKEQAEYLQRLGWDITIVPIQQIKP